MGTFYKIFLVVFIISIAVSLYAIDWQAGFMDEENTKFIFSISAGILGIIVVYILHTLSKLSERK
jgi:undecaprenyl pyrophosphate phosphatase UppP